MPDPKTILLFMPAPFGVITVNDEKDELRVATGKGKINILVKSLQKNFELNVTGQRNLAQM